MISNNGLDEYHLEEKGLGVLNNIERLGYVARHKVAAIEDEKEEQMAGERDGNIFSRIEIIFLPFSLFCLK